MQENEASSKDKSKAKKENDVSSKDKSKAKEKRKRKKDSGKVSIQIAQTIKQGSKHHRNICHCVPFYIGEKKTKNVKAPKKSSGSKAKSTDDFILEVGDSPLKDISTNVSF